MVTKSEKHERALQKIHLPEKLHLRDREQVPGQHQQRQSFGREQSLVSHVVDGENGGDFAKRGIFGIERAQHHRHQRGLPVVAVEYVGHAQNLGGFQHGPRKQGEAFGVVGIVAGRGAVERVAVEVLADNRRNKIALRRAFRAAVTTEQKRYLSSKGMVMLRTTVCGSASLVWR